MSPVGPNLFKVGEKYFDAIGRKWEVRQIFNVNGWPCLMLSLSKWTLVTLHRLTNEWHPAIVEDGGKTATILLNGGFFSTLYAEEEEE